MRPRFSTPFRLALPTLALLGAAFALAPACATPNESDPQDVDAGADGGADATADAAVDRDADDGGKGRDAAADGGSGGDGGASASDGGAEPPAEGSACTTGETFTRPCGYCGTQKAQCVGGVVAAYSACAGEVTAADRCLPGATRMSACGACGTSNDLCIAGTCRWNVGVCRNELPGGCVPGTKRLARGCANADDIQPQVCANTCGFVADGACISEAIDTINVPTDGSTAVGNFRFSAAGVVSRYPDAVDCPVNGLEDGTPYHFALLKNTTAAPILVEVYPSAAPGGAVFDTVTSAYVGRKSRPVTDAELMNCSGMTDDGGTEWSALYGPKAIAIPANGTAVVQTSQYQVATAAGQPFSLNVRTKKTAPNPLPIPATVGATVTYGFVLDQQRPVLQADAVNDLACPAAVDAATLTYGRYISLSNPTNKAARVEVWSDDTLDVVMASYAGGLPNNRATCQTVVSDACANFNHRDACLMDGNAVAIPAGGTATVYVAFSADFEPPAELPITFRTSSLQ